MSVKTIIGTYSSGYDLNVTKGDNGVDILTIASTGYVGGSGVLASGAYFGGTAYTIANNGKLSGSNAGVYMDVQGAVTNGAAGDLGGLIVGEEGIVFNESSGPALATNFGTIDVRSAGVAFYNLTANGTVINGSLEDPTALIESRYFGIKMSQPSGTVANFGTVVGAGRSSSWGVYLEDGGQVTNGAPSQSHALIEGSSGVQVTGALGTVTNFGTIDSPHSYGIALGNGGYVVNGSAADQTALVAGYQAIAIATATATVTNFGTVQAETGTAVILDDGGKVTNGGVGDHAATIQGYAGVHVSLGVGTVVNFGTIRGEGDTPGSGSDGVVLAAGGSVTNGALTDKTALIQGYEGLVATGPGLSVNFGTIVGDGLAHYTVAAYLSGGARLTNGAFNDTAALIDGYVGVSLNGGATLTNFGTVVGEQGLAVLDTGSSGAVVAEAGSAFEGSVAVGGNPVELVSGVVDMTGLSTSGAVSGAGTLALSGGTSSFGAGSSLAISAVTLSGAATAVNVATSLVYAGTWVQTGGTVSVATGDKLTLTGNDSFGATTFAGAGSVVLSGGNDTLSGAITLSATLDVTTPSLIVATGGATLSGTGVMVLSNTTSNVIYGAGASATLTVDDKIEGAGQIGEGQLGLIIDAGGAIEGSGTLALTLDTAAAVIHNAGEILAVGTGGTLADSAINNTGKLYADGGTLTLKGAVTGAGIGEISKGILFAASSFTENVTFLTGAAGTLELAHSQTYTGAVTGFSKTGATTLDLGDISFTSGTTKATYSGTTISGVLTVTDGTHTAKIKLTGNYLSSTFTTSSDGHGGTKVVDPTAPAAHAIGPTPPHAFIAAMAGMDAAGEPITATSETWRATGSALAAPKVQIA